MRRSLGVAALCAASFAAGSIAQRLYDRGTAAAGASASFVAPRGDLATTVVDFTQQPLWAYGFPTSATAATSSTGTRKTTRQ